MSVQAEMTPAEKKRVRARTQWAVRRGELVRQPCEGCGGERVEAHHVDYYRPMDVRWLCSGCHAVEHVRIRTEALPPISDLLAAVKTSAEHVRRLEDEVAVARQEYREAIGRAHAAGASYELIGRLLEISRQRVAQLAERAERSPQ